MTVGTPDGTITGGATNLTFDAAGNLTSPAGAELAVDWNGAAANSTVRLNLAALKEVATGAPTAASLLNANGSTWKLTVGTDDSGDRITAGNATYVEFDGNGTLRGPATHTVGIDWNNGASSAADSSVAFDFGTPGQANGLTSFGSEYAVGSVSQDGLAFGAYSGVSIDRNGIVNALFDNGRIRPMFKIPVAQFNNSDGLISRSGNAWQASPESGGFFLNEAGIGGAAKINSNALEASTVDLATEFTSMITTQRAYSANATIIKTADEMLQELTRIKS